jgi:adenosylcobinamide-GDP ribazoletransferase
MRWFPLAGLTIGALLAALNYGMAYLFPPPIVGLLLVALLALVTGALHLDGLADVCDGLGARGPRERFLSVMKDSSVGAVGVVGVTLGLMLKYQALVHLPSGAEAGGILLFPAAARFSQVLMTVGSLRAKEQGLGAAFIAGAGLKELLFAGVTILAGSYIILGITGIVCCIITSSFALLAKGYFHRRLGGVTGDTIGCVSELSEILCLLAVVALNGRLGAGII